MKTIFAIILFMAVAMGQVTVQNHYEGTVPLEKRALAQSYKCLVALKDAKIVEIRSIDDVVDDDKKALWRMEVALDQPLRECGAGVNGQTVNEIYHQVYFTSKDNEHKTPNKKGDPTSNQLDDATFAKVLKYKEDMTDAELKTPAKGWYEYQSKTVNNVKYTFTYDFNSNYMEALELAGFAVKSEVTTSGLPYEEFRTFLMHTIWIT